MMPLALFGSRSFVGLTLLTLLLYGALGGLFVLVPYVLIQAGGYTATQAGAALLPLPLVIAVASPAAGALAAKVGPRWLLTTGPVCLSQIKSEYIGDAARPGLEGEEYALLSEPCAIGAHPCPTIGACASHYSSSCKTAARDEDAARRIQQHGQGIPAESNRSAVQHMRFAMASAATSVDHECPWIELFE
jgi:hypothetical protein